MERLIGWRLDQPITCLPETDPVFSERGHNLLDVVCNRLCLTVFTLGFPLYRLGLLFFLIGSLLYGLRLFHFMPSVGFDGSELVACDFTRGNDIFLLCLALRNFQREFDMEPMD